MAIHHTAPQTDQATYSARYEYYAGNVVRFRLAMKVLEGVRDIDSPNTQRYTDDFTLEKVLEIRHGVLTR